MAVKLLDVPKWDVRFLELAEHVGAWSHDPSLKCGAVVVAPDRRVISVGYNGFPRGVGDGEDRYKNRLLKYQMVVHAEANAITSAREPLAGATLYCTPIPTCCECAKLIIQAGIKKVVNFDFAHPDTKDRWRESVEVSALMYYEAGVEVLTIER